MNITYSKGTFTFHDNVNDRHYAWNINENSLTNLRTDRQVMRMSISRANIEHCLYQLYRSSPTVDMLTVLYELFGNHSITLMEIFSHTQSLLLADKIINFMTSRGIQKPLRGFQYYNLQSIIDHKVSFKQITDIIVEFNNDNNIDCISCYNIVQRLNLMRDSKKYNGLPLNFIQAHRYDLDSLYTYVPQRYYDLALYYYYTQKAYLIKHNINNVLIDYFRQCDKMGKTPIKTNNLFRECIETAQAYDLWQRTDVNVRFAQAMARYKDRLQFTYGDYTLVLPTCCKDLVTEGNEMHHCVGGYGETVAKQDTLIVFVRHKDTPNKCYITAEIKLSGNDKGKLGQYYMAYDREISSLKDKEFKNALQNHLDSFEW